MSSQTASSTTRVRRGGGRLSRPDMSTTGRTSFGLHVSGVLKNGVSRGENQKVLLQTMVYSAAPSLRSVNIAAEVIKKAGDEKP